MVFNSLSRLSVVCVRVSTGGRDDYDDKPRIFRKKPQELGNQKMRGKNSGGLKTRHDSKDDVRRQKSLNMLICMVIKRGRKPEY